MVLWNVLGTGMLCSFARRSYLRTWLSMKSKTKTCIFVTKVKNFCITSWQSDSSTIAMNKAAHVYYSALRVRPPAFQIQLNKKITSMRTVKELLDMCYSVNDSADFVNRVAVLYNIAKIVHKDASQQILLGPERRQVIQQNTVFKHLLDSISKEMPQCEARHLGNIVWALGKLQEKDHVLFQNCEKEILQANVLLFSNGDVNQIVHGCSLLGAKGTAVMSTMEEAILNGKINLTKFKDMELKALLMSFAQAQWNSERLFEYFKSEILSRDMTSFKPNVLTGCLWSFAVRGVLSDELFDRVEKELLRRGTANFHDFDFFMALRAFAKSARESKKLFMMFENEICLKNFKSFKCENLQQIVSFFAKKGMKRARVFYLVEKEVVRRGLSQFTCQSLVFILWSFVQIEKIRRHFIRNVLDELCLRDLYMLKDRDICVLAWSMGRSGEVNRRLFSKIEETVLQRGKMQLTIKGMCGLMRGFIEAKVGSNELFDHLELAIATIIQDENSGEMKHLSADAICELLWCVYMAGYESDVVFDAIEKEILRQGKAYFTSYHREKIRMCFRQAQKGSSQLFKMMVDQPILK